MYKKGIEESFKFLDIIMSEVINHDTSVNQLNNKSFNELNKNSLYNTSKKIIDDKNKFNVELNEIIQEIIFISDKILI